MALRILFADDSMTAQNMGKKILTEAGYEVVAVSNGAAAVKKIAEQKPDIIILDVYMPGYSGLEVCEKVRASLDTLKTPVLLTVGKMEPYKPEDANRVKADGVIIKPFEASDLLAIVKKFEERLALAPVPPMVEQTVRLEQKYQEDAIAEAQMQNHATGKTGLQPMVEVPDHMAGSSAFTDMLGSESAAAPQHFAVNTPATAFETSVIVPAPPMPAPEYNVPISWKDELPAQPEPAEPELVTAASASDSQEITVTPVEASPIPDTVPIPIESIPESEPVEEAHASTASDAVPSEPAHPHFIPVFQESAPESYEVLPTAAAPTGDMEIPREPALQETAEDTTRSTVADHIEPGLMSSFQQPEEPQIFGTTEPQATAAESYAAAETPAAETLPKIDATSDVSDADFEARVAAAMSAYSHVSEPVAPQAPSATVSDSIHTDAASAVYAAHAVAVPEPEIAAVPSFEYHPPIRMPEAFQAEAVPPVQIAPEPPAPEPAVESTLPEPAVVHEALAASVEAATVAAAEAMGTDHDNIAQAINRVMERLKPELVEEIMRELRPKK